MARGIIYFLLGHCFILKVLSSYAQPTVQQYLQLAGAPQAHTIAIPATQHAAPVPNPAATNQPRPSTGLPSFPTLALPNLVACLQQPQVTPQTAPPNFAANQPRPTAGQPLFSALALPNLVANLQQLPSTHSAPANVATNIPRPTSEIHPSTPAAPPKLTAFPSLQPTPNEIKTATPSSIDSKLLNNLAIALQLLIVSNILNAPPPPVSSVAKPGNDISVISEHNQSPCYSQCVIPNSNFVGTSSLAEPNLVQTYKPTRSSLSLMSPYEALGPVSSYSDPIFSQYGSINPRQDFQSPYAMIADSDLFTMNDLF